MSFFNTTPTISNIKIKSSILFLSIFLFLSIIFSNKAFATGFAVDSHSASGLANSYAGSSTGVHDIGDSFFNPAILSEVKTNVLAMSASYLNIKVDDDNANAQYRNSSLVEGTRNDNAGVKALIPAFFFATPINNKTTFGISTTIPFGLSTKYDQNWVGRYHAIETTIETANINPSLSYKLNQNLSVGAGLQAQYFKATLTKMVDIASHQLVNTTPGTLDAIGESIGDDWGYGFNLGLKYKATDDLDIGIGYRSKIKHKIEGRVRVKSATLSNPSSDFNALITTPETLIFGFKYNLTDRLLLAQDTSWTRWSRLKSLDINATDVSTLSEKTELGWKDSWKYTIGLNYQLNDKWLLRSGLAYEEGAVDKKRNPRLPTGDAIWTTAGFEYEFNDRTKIDFTYLHQFFNKTNTNIDNSNSGIPVSSLRNNSKISLDLISIGAKVEF